MQTLAALATTALLASAACFVGYDSRWGQAKAAQKRLAAESTPEAINAPSVDQASRVATRTYRVRFRPNAHYLAQTVTPERQLEQLLSDSDGMLRSAIGLRLELDKIEPWSLDRDDRLETALGALRTDDPGEDVDVVVGLIGALPGPTESLHQLGYSEVLGKHVVIRAASRLGEHDAFDRALVELSDEEREHVVRARRRHRAEAVFLHELGHVLGALHEAEVTSLMHPAYDTKMDGFGEDAIALMRFALTEKDRPAVARAQLDYVRNAKSPSWPAGEREQAEKYLENMMGAAIASSAAPVPTRGPVAADGGPPAAAARGLAARPQAPPELRDEDRERFVRATQLLRAAAVSDAYRIARPLFAAYPNSRDVQDLRCQLATVRWLGADALRAECSAYVRLVDAGAADAP